MELKWVSAAGWKAKGNAVWILLMFNPKHSKKFPQWLRKDTNKDYGPLLTAPAHYNWCTTHCFHSSVRTRGRWCRAGQGYGSRPALHHLTAKPKVGPRVRLPISITLSVKAYLELKVETKLTISIHWSVGEEDGVGLVEVEDLRVAVAADATEKNIYC